MGQCVIYVFTHDSIGVGEDGTTHQPVEQLANLRAVPRLVVIRPGDANETACAWRVAIETRDRSVALVLTRQDVSTLDRALYAPAEGLRRGAYVLYEAAGGKPELILIATGSEVDLIVEAQKQLQKVGIQVRLVSMPSWQLFDMQSEDYRRSVFPPSVRARLAVEAGATQGWHRYIGDQGDVIGLDHFGASGPAPILMREFGFTAENVCLRARALLERNRA
jgi:transketolase